MNILVEIEKMINNKKYDSKFKINNDELKLYLLQEQYKKISK